jgi:hypothetical protein
VTIHSFGDPFCIKVSESDTVGMIKPRIQAKLGISDEEFAKWKLAMCSASRPDYLTDDVVIGERLTTSTRREWGGTCTLTLYPHAHRLVVDHCVSQSTAVICMVGAKVESTSTDSSGFYLLARCGQPETKGLPRLQPPPQFVLAVGRDGMR